MGSPRDTSRKLFKRELERIIGNMEWALTHLARFIEAYSEFHPDLSAQAVSIGEGIIFLIDAVKKLDEQV